MVLLHAAASKLAYFHSWRRACRSLKPAKHAAHTLLRHKAELDGAAGPPLQAATQPEQAPPQEPAEWQTARGRDADRPESSQGAGQAGAHGDEAGSSAAGGGAQAGASDPSGDQQRLESYPLPESPEQQRRQGPAGGPPAPPEASHAGAAEPDLAHAGGSGGLSGAAHGAGDDVRWLRGPVRGLGFGGGFGGAKPPLRVLGAEWHSRVEQDWYAVNVAVDLVTFVYVALFYQVRFGSCAALMHASLQGALWCSCSGQVCHSSEQRVPRQLCCKENFWGGAKNPTGVTAQAWLRTHCCCCCCCCLFGQPITCRTPQQYEPMCGCSRSPCWA